MLKIKHFLTLIILFSVTLFASFNLFAAQLIDKTPSPLIENWSVCINYHQKETLCKKQSTPYINDQIDDQVFRFTYEKEFIVSSELKNTKLGISLNVIDEVDEVQINGHIIGKTGNFPPQFYGDFRTKRLYFIPSNIIKYNQFNYLKIKTYSSINKPGIKHQIITIDDYFEQLFQQQNNDKIITAIFSILLILAFLQLFYYFMLKGSVDTLYLSFYFISFASVCFTRSQMPLHLGLDLTDTFKIEIFMINLAIVSFSFFIFQFFNLELRKPYIIAIVLLSFPSLVNIIYPNTLQVRLLADISYWMTCIMIFFTGGSAIIIALHKKLRYSWLIGTLCFFGWIMLCYDMLSFTNIWFHSKLPLSPQLLLISTVIVAISTSLTITHKYWQLFKGGTYDHLTGALLRPAFFQRLTEEIQRSQVEDLQLLVAIINIQEVKTISENYNLGVKNNILKMVSNTLTKNLKPFDLVCHFSEDEFCISSTLDSSEQAKEHIKKLHFALTNARQEIGGETAFFISVKISAVIYDIDKHLSVPQLLQDANYGLAKIMNEDDTNYILLNTPPII